MAQEDTKAATVTVTTEKDPDVTKDDSKQGEIDGTSLEEHWQCQRCRIYNPCDNWRCVACFAQRKVSKNEFDNFIPSTMKGLIKRKAGAGYEYSDSLQVMKPGVGEVLVKSYRTGICENDLILYDWNTKKRETSLISDISDSFEAFTPGHETSGVVVQIGEKTGLKVGQRVAIENHQFCGECYQCNNQRKDICSNMGQFGYGKGSTQGGCCEYFVVRAEYCYRLRKRNTTWRDAALLEPLGIAVNGCEKAQIGKSKNESVLVIGATTIGCLTVAVCKALKVSNIVCIDINDTKLNVAKKYGAQSINVKNFKDEKESLNELLKCTNGIGFDKIIECSGDSKIISTMFKMIRKGGVGVFAALPNDRIIFEDPISDIIFKELTIHSVRGRKIYDTWKRAEDLVSKGLINLDHIVTDEIALSNFKDGFDKLKSGKASKIIFDTTK